MSDLGYLLSILFGLATGVQMISDHFQKAIGTAIIGICSVLLVDFLYKKMQAVTEIPSIKFLLPNYFIRKIFRRYLRPVSKFKLWLNGRADEGMKLYKSKIPDNPTENIIGTSAPDHDTHKEFNIAYGRWRDEVAKGIAIACGMQNANTIFPPRISDPNVASVFIYGGGRRQLLKEIDFLGIYENMAKTIWLIEAFKNDSNILEEYETFKFKNNQ
jgi:hypothetical protein